VRLEQLAAIWSEDRDPIAVRKPVSLQRAGEPPGPFVELRPSEPVVAVDNCDPIGKGGPRPFEKRERSQGQEVNAVRDGVPYNAHGDRRD
jgi:hypothetical protein